MERRLLIASVASRMLDREKIVTVLKRRFPGSTTEQVAAAANALVGLEDEWVEVQLSSTGAARACREGCYLQRIVGGREVKVFSRVVNH